MAIMGIGSIEPSRRARRRAATPSPPTSATRCSTRAPSATSATASSAPTARSCAATLDDRIIAIPVENLPRIPRRVGIAGGERKLEAIHGALAGGWVTTLVTDLRTAEALAER